MPLKYSVIILNQDQYPDFAEYVRNLCEIFLAKNAPFEILIVANGTGMFLRTVLPDTKDYKQFIKAYEFPKKISEGVSLRSVVKEAQGEILVVCGSYQQISNESFSRLLDSMDDTTDIVCPWRRHRVDSFLSRFQSWGFNYLVRRIAGTGLHDFSCLVRIFRREVFEETEIYGNMYRFLPLLAEKKGFKTREIECEHYQERGEAGLYVPSDYLTRLIDIFALFFNTRFTKKPLRFFSAMGLGFLCAGLLMILYLFVERFVFGHPIGNRSGLILSLLLIVFGVQSWGVGLLGEIVAFAHGRDKKEYTVEKEI